MAHRKHEGRYPLYCTACRDTTSHQDHVEFTECLRCGAHGFWMVRPEKQAAHVHGSDGSDADGRSQT